MAEGNQGFTLDPGEGIIVALENSDCDKPWTVQAIDKHWSTF